METNFSLIKVYNSAFLEFRRKILTFFASSSVKSQAVSKRPLRSSDIVPSILASTESVIECSSVFSALGLHATAIATAQSHSTLYPTRVCAQRGFAGKHTLFPSNNLISFFRHFSITVQGTYISLHTSSQNAESKALDSQYSSICAVIPHKCCFIAWHKVEILRNSPSCFRKGSITLWEQILFLPGGSKEFKKRKNIITDTGVLI